MIRQRGFLLLSQLLGLLLLAAAALKVFGLSADPVARAGLFSAPWFHALVIELEVLLGLWLLWGEYPVGSWLASIVTFMAFACVSFYLGWIGEASCGCFGAAQISPTVSPWVMFGVDVALVLLLSVVRPPLGSSPIPIRRAFRIGLLAAGIIAVCVGICSWKFGSFEAALAYLNGRQMTVDPSMLDIGAQKGGEKISARLALVNRSDREIRVVGGTDDCGCITTEDLPVTLAPGDSREVTVWLKLPKAQGSFTRTAWFWTDADEPQVMFSIVGRVLGSP
jgi:methylamine utilization protein MauE/uncharacterized protein DUF1573